MSEVIRFTLSNHSARQRGADIVQGPDIGDVEVIRLREDRATETERERIETWLEEHYGGPVRDHIGEWGGHEEWGADARELLDMLFGEEASRG